MINITKTKVELINYITSKVDVKKSSLWEMYISELLLVFKMVRKGYSSPTIIKNIKIIKESRERNYGY